MIPALQFEILEGETNPVPVLYLDGQRIVLPVESFRLEANASEPGFAHLEVRMLVETRGLG